MTQPIEALPPVEMQPALPVVGAPILGAPPDSPTPPAPQPVTAPPWLMPGTGAVSIGRHALTVQANPGAQSQPIRYVDLAKLAREGVPPIEWLVEGWLGREEIGVVAGAPKAGKTTQLDHFVLHLAAGLDWFGFHVPQAARVLVFDEEQSKRTAARRLLRLANGLDVAPWDELSVAVSQGVRLDTREGITRLEREIAEHRPALVYLDSLAKVYGAVDEKDNTALSTISRELNRLRNAYKCAFLFAHHVTKPAFGRTVKGQRLALIRGGGEIVANADAVWWVERQHDAAEVSVEVRRDSDATDEPSVEVSYSAPEGTEGPIRLEGNGPVHHWGEAKQGAAGVQLAHLAGRSPSRAGDLDAVVKEATGGSESTAKRARATLKERGLATDKGADGRGWWEITDKGRQEFARAQASSPALSDQG